MTPPAGATDHLSEQSPWPGLRAFAESDREFFFGRERESEEILRLIDRSPVVVLYGQSGLGKTSLIQAGILPALRRLSFLPLRLVLRHDEGAGALADQIAEALTAELDASGVSAPRPERGKTLWEYFHRHDVDFWGKANRLLTPVIVLDQFEEAFTIGQSSEKAMARVNQLISDLASVIEHFVPPAVRERLKEHPEEADRYDLRRESVKFVISLREDFLPHLDTWRARIPSLLPTRFRLEPMTGARAITVVEQSGRDLVTPAVAHDIVEFVSTSQRTVSPRALEDREVSPALLSLVCDELNRRRLKRNEPQISASLLTSERDKIIEDFYERAFAGVDRRVRAWVEDRLLTDSGFRNHAALDDAVGAASTGKLSTADFNLLIDRRVLHREQRGNVVWLELTHDLLTDPASKSRAARKQRQETEAIASRLHVARRQFLTIVAVAAICAGLALYGFLKARDFKHETAIAQNEQAHADSETVRADSLARRADRAAANAKEMADSAVTASDKLTAKNLELEKEKKQNVLTSEFADDFVRLVARLRQRDSAEKRAARVVEDLAVNDTLKKVRAQLQNADSLTCLLVPKAGADSTRIKLMLAIRGHPCDRGSQPAPRRDSTTN